MTPTAAAPVVELAEPRSEPTAQPVRRTRPKAKAKAEVPPKPRLPRLSVRESAARALRDLADRADEQI
jgi:hypothetical protein